jgi:hypothetical protein
MAGSHGAPDTTESRCGVEVIFVDNTTDRKGNVPSVVPKARLDRILENFNGTPPNPDAEFISNALDSLFNRGGTDGVTLFTGITGNRTHSVLQSGESLLKCNRTEFRRRQFNPRTRFECRRLSAALPARARPLGNDLSVHNVFAGDLDDRMRMLNTGNRL